MSDRQEKKPEERRPLTPEEREQMKRELKRQMRAYVDALKESILGAKKKGENPDLDAAMAEAAQKAEKKLMEEAAAGDPMVKEAARVQAQAQAARRAQQAAPQPQEPQRHDGVIPKFSAWRPAGQGDDAAAKADPATEKEKEKDVLEVASAAPAQAEVKTSQPEEKSEREKACEEGGEKQEFLVPEEEAKKSALPREELERLTRDIIAALKTVYDPEIPVDIYELGLVYRIDIADDRTVTIDMTLTAPGCPVAGEMPAWVQKAVSEVEGVKDVKVNLVFDPPWDMSRMSDEARLALNMF